MIGNIYYSGGSGSNTTFKGSPVYSTTASPSATELSVYSTPQCSPISSFTCPAVVKTLPVTINFTGVEGGLKDKNGATTGFTMVDKPSAPLVTPTYSNVPGYEPSKLAISSGKLLITTTAGISYLNPAQSAKTNSQVNALGVGFIAPPKFAVQTTLVQPNAGSGKSEQAGLWFGLDEDNYVSLIVVSVGGGASKIEMRKEVAAMSGSTDAKSSASMNLSSSAVKLRVIVSKVSNTIEAFYSINGASEVKLGTLTIPQSFTAGKTLSDGVTANTTFAGIFATHRSAAAPLTFSFEDFKVSEIINAQFVKVSLPNTVGKHSTLQIGPDGKLYALTIDGIIKRFSINSDGTLGTPQLLYSLQDSYGTRKQRLAVGFAFDPAATATNLIAWVTHCSYVFLNGPNWDGKLTKLSGGNLQSTQDVLINLPRSVKDHLTNSIAFGPDGALYFNQGDNSNMGRADSVWGNRAENLLSSALLRLDRSKLGSLPLNVKTKEGGGTYNPYLSTSPLTIYASGLRNAYDLLWHSNGQLYVPTNGASVGGNTPASVNGTLRPDGSSYNGPSVPALTNVQQAQKDFLFRVKKGGYYGHPNPLRGEYVQNGGNPTASTDPAQVNAYPVGTLPDANWKGYAFDFQDHKSPNGIIEYKSSRFDGSLKGRILVVRYANNNDIITLTAGGTNKDIISSTEGTSIPGFSGFNDPLDLIEDVRTGNIYVSEYGGSGKITLLKPQVSVPITSVNYHKSIRIAFFSNMKSISSISPDISRISPSLRVLAKNKIVLE
jgi:glucose/arabinose dehydrogenase